MVVDQVPLAMKHELPSAIGQIIGQHDFGAILQLRVFRDDTRTAAHLNGATSVPRGTALQRRSQNRARS